MLGICGEYIVESTNLQDDIVQGIIEYEKTLNTNIGVFENFKIKKIGIESDKDCSIKINNRLFSIKEDNVLEFGYDVYDIVSIVANTEDVRLVIRYLY